MLPRSLTFAQKQRLTNSLFWTCAGAAVFVVALPSFLPCPAIKSQKAGVVYADDDQSNVAPSKGKDTRQVLISPRVAKDPSSEVQK